MMTRYNPSLLQVCKLGSVCVMKSVTSFEKIMWTDFVLLLLVVTSSFSGAYNWFEFRYFLFFSFHNIRFYMLY